MTITQVVDAYAEELENWDFFSDSQRAYVDKNNHIVVCLRNYSWYITKNPIIFIDEAIKALFEIDWIAEFEDEGTFKYIGSSKYWKEIW